MFNSLSFLSTASSNFETGIEELLVAIIACGGASLSNWENISLFNSNFSGIASIIRSASFTASERVSWNVISP